MGEQEEQKKLEDYKSKLSSLSLEELREECLNLWIDLQAEKDYQQTLIQEGQKIIDMEKDEKEYYENKYLDEKHKP